MKQISLYKPFTYPSENNFFFKSSLNQLKTDFFILLNYPSGNRFHLSLIQVGTGFTFHSSKWKQVSPVTHSQVSPFTHPSGNRFHLSLIQVETGFTCHSFKWKQVSPVTHSSGNRFHLSLIQVETGFTCHSFKWKQVSPFTHPSGKRFHLSLIQVETDFFKPFTHPII